jgi:hypothetical protein
MGVICQPTSAHGVLMLVCYPLLHTLTAAMMATDSVHPPGGALVLMAVDSTVVQVRKSGQGVMLVQGWLHISHCKEERTLDTCLRWFAAPHNGVTNLSKARAPH